jgi:hypothetical protein
VGNAGRGPDFLPVLCWRSGLSSDDPRQSSLAAEAKAGGYCTGMVTGVEYRQTQPALAEVRSGAVRKLPVAQGAARHDHYYRAVACQNGVHERPARAPAGQRRLRPILMTALATVFGMLPLALGVGSGAQMLQPLAIAVIGGVTVSMLLSLLVTPVIYYQLRKVRNQ